MILKEKNFGTKEKILRKYWEKVQVFKGYPCKKFTKYFAYFVSEHSKHFFFILRKKMYFLAAGPKNESFFYVLPKFSRAWWNSYVCYVFLGEFI